MVITFKYYFNYSIIYSSVKFSPLTKNYGIIFPIPPPKTLNTAIKEIYKGLCSGKNQMKQNSISVFTIKEEADPNKNYPRITNRKFF